MTEEIIIDGVNVAGCRYFQDGMCYAEKDNEGYTDIECNYDNYDCYFKQLERIKLENKALYVLKNSLCKMIDEDSEKIKRLGQENKEEKKAYNECMHYLACMTEQRNKLKTALEEIREYSQSQVEHYERYEEIEAMCDWQDVVDRINEVLNDKKL